MYVGRIVALGQTRSGRLTAMYRVSSRSFPNRQTRIIGRAVAVVPREGFESDIYRNPYIAYNCLRVEGPHAVIGNGSHVDPLAERLASGAGVRDALVTVLHGMDYEHDQLRTPRIAAVADARTRTCALGIVRHDALLVRYLPIARGEAFYLATYEHNAPDERFRDGSFNVGSAEDGCEYILGRGAFAALERPISAACAFETEQGFATACRDVSA